jgi:hypothetical protein
MLIITRSKKSLFNDFIVINIFISSLNNASYNIVKINSLNPYNNEKVIRPIYRIFLNIVSLFWYFEYFYKIDFFYKVFHCLFD